jgi:hypothetical protein
MLEQLISQERLRVRQGALAALGAPSPLGIVSFARLRVAALAPRKR